MKILFIKIILGIVAIYFSGCTLLYFFQEKILFHPTKIDQNYQYQFDQPFDELFIKTADNIELNGLLFKTKQPKGLIFYLHGNAGALDKWGEIADVYTQLDYDIFILDYRGYGKSDGKILNETQLYNDNQRAYDYLKTRYPEDSIIIIGYSIGSGMAAQLASENNPKLLILQAPYYSMTDLVQKRIPFLPTFILKYKLTTNKFLENCNMPIVLYHGDEDKVIYYGSSVKLKEDFPAKIKLITLNNQGHNGITDNEAYQQELKQLLE